MDRNTLGPAERIIQTLLTFTDHAVHNRPGMVVPAPGTATGKQWSPVTSKLEGADKVIYKLTKAGKKNIKTRVGVADDQNVIAEKGIRVGEYRPAGIFPEVAAWMYRQVAEVWKVDNEFSARWASYAFGQEHRDLKVVLAAFMLVQSRKGDPVLEDGKVVFYDEDYRDIGEAMLLLTKKDGNDFNPKLILRIEDVLKLPEIAAINKELGFYRGAKNFFPRRYDKVVTKWLLYREQNPKMLEGLVKAGFRTSVMELAHRVHYKPETPRFFEILRWKQDQAKDGRRTMAIGKAVAEAETWKDLTEREICERIVKDKPDFKRVVGLLPAKIGLTRAVVAAAIEAGSMSNKDLVIYTPTLEELGLLQVQDIRERWEQALKKTEDMRAANIATRVKSTAVKEKLEEGADNALKKIVQEAVKGLRVYVIVDISGSMKRSIVLAKEYIAKFLQSFPLDQLHVSTFNTVGRVVEIKHASAAGVENAFRGIDAQGGTSYGAGVLALAGFKPKADEDALMIFVGDEGQATTFPTAVQQSGINPMAFGLIKVPGDNGRAVTETANQMEIPCFPIDEKIFADPYAIPRTIRALVAATPVGKFNVGPTPAPRVSLIDLIVATQLLKKPMWA